MRLPRPASFRPPTCLRAAALLAVAAAALFGSGCQALKSRTDNATLEPGPRFDENGKLTNDPKVSVPIWSSKGLKEKPQDITPPKS
jgi:hypothetical protein